MNPILIHAEKPANKITHGEKILFPEAGITKNDLAIYYEEISSYILPFLKDRPLTIQRFPEGIQKQGFFQQHAFKNPPSWFATVSLPKKEGGSMKHFLCQNKESLIYLVDQGMITPHRWLSRIQQPDYPDLLIVDIDPPSNKFNLACKGAKEIKSLFDQIKLISFVMTTGSKGLHVVIPIKPQFAFDECRSFVKNILQKLVNKYNDEFTLEIRKEHRGERVFLDVLRNTYGHTAVAPYAVRTLPSAPIATPLEWEELEDKKLYSQKYTLKNIQNRLKIHPEIWRNHEQAIHQTLNDL